MSPIQLSLILLFQSDCDLSYQITCLRKIVASKNNAHVEIIVVGLFFDQDYQTIIEACTDLGCGYLNYTNSLSATSGVLRNFAAQHATGELLIFQEINMISWQGIYDEILEEALVVNLTSQIKNFVIVPCVYLSKFFSERVLFNNSKRHLRQIMTSYIQYGLGKDFLCFDPSASIIIMNRHHFFSIGGFNERIKCSYGSKIEFVNRLITENDIYIRSDKFYDSHYDVDNLRDYEFYYEFSLYGVRTASAGLVMFGLTNGDVDPLLLGITKEVGFIISEMKAADNYYAFRLPLQSLHNNYNILAMWDKNSIYNFILRQALPFIGKISNISLNEFNDVDSFVDYLSRNKVSRIIFYNPYLDSLTQRFYHKVRALQLPYYVFERGALPDSWFFDANGFNADSTTYLPVHWENLVLTMQELNKVDNYIFKLQDHGSTLEFNYPRKGKVATRKCIDNVCNSANKKILFISLQRDSDTVTNYFAGVVKNYAGFVESINSILELLDREEWIVIAKKHPLEEENILFRGQVYYMNDAHIYDLLEVSDKVILLNSGVGVLAMLFNKHVIHLGETFYSHPQINTYAPNPETAVSAINSIFVPDSLLIKKFIYYLRFKVYSFGVSKTVKKGHTAVSNITATCDINFYELRLPGIGEYVFNTNYRKIPVNAPLQSMKLAVSNVINDSMVNHGIDNDMSFFQKKALRLFGGWLKLTKCDDIVVSSYLSNPRKFFYNTHSRFTRIIGKLIF